MKFSELEKKEHSVAVVIPCFKVTKHILGVLSQINTEIDQIYVIDDACPENSGKLVEEQCLDPRVTVIYHQKNLGVGGAVMTGYRAAIAGLADIIVKVDGDGQMDPKLIPYFILPIINGDADYTKGNRFFYLEEIHHMPKIRIFGNAVLSFMSKLSTGYWNIFDPTNGYTAIHANVAAHLPYDKVSKRYFFETDLLFRLNTLTAAVVDIPMSACYADEISNLKVHKIITEFFFKHCRNFLKRLFYNYYLRDVSIASLELPVGLALLLSGIVFGIMRWIQSAQNHLHTSAGTVMLAALPILMGLQFIMAFIGYDIAAVPKHSINRKISTEKALPFSSMEKK